MFLWRIVNQEQARTVVDHFAFSVDSSCIIISGKKDNLKRLTEIFEKNFRIRSIPFDFEKNFRKFGRMERALDFLKTERNRITVKHLPWNYIELSSRINCYQSGKCREPKWVGSKHKFVGRETSHSYLHVFWRDAPAKFNQFFRWSFVLWKLMAFFYPSHIRLAFWSFIVFFHWNGFLVITGCCKVKRD